MQVMNAYDWSKIPRADPGTASGNATNNVQKSTQLLLAVVCDNLETAATATRMTANRTVLRLLRGDAA